MKLRIRPRRLRVSSGIRNLVRETRLSRRDLVYPLFVKEGIKDREAIESMPGQYRYPLDQIADVVAGLSGKIPAVILFGIPRKKDEICSQAYDEEGIVQRAIREIKKETDVVVITDVCLCHYNSTGHCGILSNGVIANDESVKLIAKTALSHANAGADIVAPSDMMDGRVGAIRSILDSDGFEDVAIMSYSAKYASAFYGPFRDAAYCAPEFGDRRSYQMDPTNSDEALREAALDIKEGADIIMVKPALPYLDIIRRIKDEFRMPTAAYNVSGEYSMIKASAQKGWLNEEDAVLEMILSIKRAGAGIIITYFARDYADLL
jgi:porphobilinogen synthase